MLLDKDGDVNWSKLVALSAQANTAAEQGESGAAASTADEHAKDAINRLMNDLVDSSAGSALRRLAMKAVRKVCCLRRAFAHSSSRSLEHLSPARWQTFPSELSSPPRSPSLAPRSAAPAPRIVACEIYEGSERRRLQRPNGPSTTTHRRLTPPIQALRPQRRLRFPLHRRLARLGRARRRPRRASRQVRRRPQPARSARADDDAFPPLAPA